MSPSLIVSIVAVIISGIAVYISWRTQKRLVDIEDARELDRLAEKKKAYLTAKFTKEESSRSRTSRIYRKCYLEVENKGLSEARNIKLVLDNKPVMEHSGILQTQSEVKQVGSESGFRYELAVTGGPKVPSKVEISWEDDSGEPGEYSTMLTL
jgi:hypothetical protein